MNVHTHGPDEGRGIDCGEIRLADGSPLGWCQLLPVIRKAKAEAWEHGAFDAALSLDHTGHNATNPYKEES